MKVKVSHILVKHQYEADDILRLLDAGSVFEELAKKYSICPSSKTGGSLGEVPIQKLDTDFADALIELIEGQISKPVRTRFGYHIIRRDG